MVILLGAGKGMTEIKSEYRCETCAFFIGKMENFFKVDQPFCKNPKMIEYFKSLPKDPGVSKDGKSSWLSQDVIRKGDLWFAPLSHSDIERNSVLGCLGHSAMIEQKPSYKDLVDHIRWTQNLWRHGIEIMRKNNLVIASDTPMEKLAFTFYSDLCEIDSRALHLFGEGPGDENYKDRSVIEAWEIVPYPRPYEEGIRQEAEKQGYERALKWVYNSCECIPYDPESRDFDKGFHQAMTLVRGWIDQKLPFINSITKTEKVEGDSK